MLNRRSPQLDEHPDRFAPQSTPLERFLIGGAIVLLPLQDAFNFAGLSPIYVWIAVIGFVIFLTRLGGLLRVLRNRIFLAASLFLLVGFISESLHVAANYDDLIRMAEVVVGAALVGTLCRDRAALTFAMYAWVAAGLWLSVYLIFTTYGPLRAAFAINFYQASVVRADVVENGLLRANVNTLAFITAVGASTALALALGAQSMRRRMILLAAFMLCFLGSFLPLSRAGVAIAAISSGFVALARSKGRIRAMLMTVGLAATVLVLVPSVVFSRLEFPTQIQENQLEARSHLLQVSVESLPQYIWWGVGSGHYWTSWAYENGFVAGIGVVGAHNEFVQIAIFWGLPGLLAFVTLTWLVFRSLPPGDGSDRLAICLRTLALCLLLRLLVSSDVVSKEIALGLGLLIGSDEWIWRRVRATATMPAQPTNQSSRA